MTTLELFRLLCPDLSGEADARVEDFFTVVATGLDSTSFGVRFEEAVVRLTGHLMLFSPAGGTGGANVGGLGGGTITSRKTGDEAITFGSSFFNVANVANSDADLMLTHHGRQFIAIRDTRSVTAPSFVTIF